MGGEIISFSAVFSFVRAPQIQWWPIRGQYVMLTQTKWPPLGRRHFQFNFFIKIDELTIQISLKFGPNGPIINKPALVQIMARCQTGTINWNSNGLIQLTRIFVTRHLRVNEIFGKNTWFHIIPWCINVTGYWNSLSRKTVASTSHICFTVHYLFHNVTFLVLKQVSSWRTRSIPCLLLLWLLASPGQQQRWHWLCRVNRL